MTYSNVKECAKARESLEVEIEQVKSAIELGQNKDKDAARVVSQVRDFNVGLYALMQEVMRLKNMAFCRYKEKEYEEGQDPSLRYRGHEVARSQWVLLYEFESPGTRRLVDGCKACYKQAQRENKKIHLTWRSGGQTLHGPREGMLGDLVPKSVKYEPGQVPEVISERYGLPLRLAVTIDLLRPDLVKRRGLEKSKVR